MPLHVEHIKARKHGGDDSELNLAFACDRWK
ncbi:MAG: HNH endonuclease [Planctomycetes bacterium]|nr:HNH endonuclease [Planctomycetota bacterium]